MKIALFGATGGVGNHVLEQALRLGHEVRLLARDPGKVAASDRVEVIPGDITDASVVARTVEGTDAVIWAAGATRNHADQVASFETGARNLVAAMGRHGVRRLIALSGAGITVAGERKPLAGRLMSAIVKVAAKHVYQAKLREYEIFSASDLEWTLLRPPRVVEGRPTGHVLVDQRIVGPRVTQGDLALAMVQQLEDATYRRQAPFVSSGD